MRESLTAQLVFGDSRPQLSAVRGVGGQTRAFLRLTVSQETGSRSKVKLLALVAFVASGSAVPAARLTGVRVYIRVLGVYFVLNRNHHHDHQGPGEVVHKVHNTVARALWGPGVKHRFPTHTIPTIPPFLYEIYLVLPCCRLNLPPGELEG